MANRKALMEVVVAYLRYYHSRGSICLPLTVALWN